MKKTRFTDERMVTILRQAAQRAVPDVAKNHGVSAQTIYAWRKHFGTLEPADVKRLRRVEHENGRLKKIVVDCDLEIAGRARAALRRAVEIGPRKPQANALQRACPMWRSAMSTVVVRREAGCYGHTVSRNLQDVR